MTEHGWPEHHDDVPDPGPADDLYPPHDDLPRPDEGAGHDDDLVVADDPPGGWDVPPEAHRPVEHHDPTLDDTPPDDAAAGHGAPVGADLDAVAEPDGSPEVFPPAVDVGPLPEPVDGFPWIDTGSLGVADIAAAAAPAAPDVAAPDVAAPELAAYAAVDLPPGADPWDALAASDDPATAALARFYRPGDTGPGEPGPGESGRGEHAAGH